MARTNSAAEAVRKTQVLDEVGRKGSAFSKYLGFFVGGEATTASLLRYELVNLLGQAPGAAGYLFRSRLFPKLLAGCGKGVQFGKRLALRHPGKIRVGAGTAFDDDCLLDARGLDRDDRFVVGQHVLVARNVVLQAKTDHGFIEIGDHSSIGNNTTLTSAGGIRVGAHVGIAGHCYLGGARYHTDRAGVPMMKTDPFTNGPITIGDDCWIGMGVRILDGVSIGAGCVIGAGAVIREDVPDRTVAAPHQRIVMLQREIEGDPGRDVQA